MPPTFVHLHLHTEYSIVDGIVRIPALVEAVRAAGMPAVAVTEQSHQFSMVKFYRAAMAAGVKPLLGADVWVRGDGGAPARLVLLARDQAGFRNLSRLVSRGYVEGYHGGVPALEREWFREASDGLLALSGAAGDVGQALLAGRAHEARARLERWLALFPDRFYLELTRAGREDDDRHVASAVDLAAAAGAPVVATNDVRFLAREDHFAHEARVCIHEGRVINDPRRERHSEEQYLKPPAEMAALFADIPEAIENAVEIARRCNVELRLGENFLPAFPVPGGKAVEEWFEEQSRAGLESRLAAQRVPADRRPGYLARLERELEVIVGMGFPGYFLIVADFIRWARDHGVPVGPGRGSGAGSLVAYALGITNLDPIEHDLLFERFLNPERVSLPDFDVDFCMEGRDRVIDYVSSRYGGEDRVSQIITFGTLAAKAVVRDVGRVLGHPYGFVDQIAKLIPFELGMTLERALAEEERLAARYEAEEDVRGIIDLARTLEGVVRNAGRHAGGVVIAPSSLTDFTPVYREQGATSLVTQLDKDDVERVGLVKFDFLGLRTLTIIDRAQRAINAERERTGETPIDVDALAPDDAATYRLVKSGATTAVFQLESRGMKELIRGLQPDDFEELTALVALFRPGPLQSGMVEDFINRKHGRAQVQYLHPALEPILKPTYGVILYQEQVMQIAQTLAGYTLGGADLLRRAMGKKKPAEMAKQRAVFVDGAAVRGVERRLAESIFDVMEKFAGYGFNKSHSAAYALIAYQTAWLKTHHPAAFMAAVLSADMDHTDKVVTFIDESRAMGLEVLPPDVNACEHAFTARDERTIRYGLGAIKGVGRSAIQCLIEERERGGPFADLFDFCARVDARRLNRRVTEALIRAGALNELGPSRGAMMATLTHAMQTAEQHARNASVGQDDLFGEALDGHEPVRCFVDAPDWPEEERLLGEKETLGLYLTGHPITRHEPEIERLTGTRLASLRPSPGHNVLVAGLVLSLRARNSRHGRMALATLDDRTGRIDAVVYSDLYQQTRDVLAKDRLLLFEGEVVDDEVTGGCQMIVRDIVDLEAARARRARSLLVTVGDGEAANGFVDRLAETLAPFRDGPTPVCIEYRGAGARARLALGERWRVRPSEELLGRLRELAGPERVEVTY